MTPRRTEKKRITVCSLLVIDSAHQARLSDILKATFRGRDPTLNLIVPQPSSARPRGMSLETCRPVHIRHSPGQYGARDVRLGEHCSFLILSRVHRASVQAS
jgi:hypothetical protein